MSNVYIIHGSTAIIDSNNNGSYDPSDEVTCVGEDGKLGFPHCWDGKYPEAGLDLDKERFEELAQKSGFDVAHQSYALPQLTFDLNRAHATALAQTGHFTKTKRELANLELLAAEAGIPFDGEWAAGLLRESALRCFEEYPAKLRNFHAKDPCGAGSNTQGAFQRLEDTLRSASEFLGLPFNQRKWDKLQQKLPKESYAVCW